MVKSNKNSVMGTYHTTLRNIGLYSSLSLGLLSFAEKGVLKEDISNKVLFPLGIVFLLISFVLSKELKEYTGENKKDISRNLTIIATIINYTLIVFLTMVIYSLLHRYDIL